MALRVHTAALVGLLALLPQLGSAQTPEELFQTGKYDEAAAAAQVEIDRGVWNERWPRLLMQAQLARGKYAQAVQTYEQAIQRYSNSLVLRLLAREALLASGQSRQAQREADEIFMILQRPAGRFATSDNLVAAGRYFALHREDARQILQFFYDRVRAAEPQHLEAAIATAELAIEKGDFQVAAQTLNDIKQLQPGDPRIDYLLSRAFASSDSEQANAALQRALQRNPQHVPSLLAMADAAINRERYADAEAVLTQVLEVNVHQPEAWALLAVIAHLRGQGEIEQLMRAAALSTWAENPEVDHLIGRKLSQLYRFAEGAEYQRRALTFDPGHPGASFQLAEDLLRLGYDDVGWELAKTVAAEDPYNVVAYNLVTLYDRLQGFATLRGDGILVRMDPREAAIYGDAVLELLSDARQVLCSKYNVDPAGIVGVEIFPQQKDFAIRTFGLPGGAGFLGVCFGRVITANSPASQGERPSNWQSVLWHEYCHAVTLEKTKNRMPRWLSEGISVYEERQRDSSSGESMTPQYREMLLDEELTPVSRLSGAFLSPPSPVHLQFAYYQSSLVVEYLIEQHGFEAINQILDDLGAGISINDALTRSVGSLDRLDNQFAAYARKRANSFAPDVDWSKDDLPARATPEQWAEWNQEHPQNFWGQTRWAQSLIAADRHAEALKPLEDLVRRGAITGSPGGPLEMLADTYGKLGQTDKQRRALEKLITLSDDALPALRQLAEFAQQDEDWAALANYARKILAVHPLLPLGHEYLATAADRLENPADTVTALTALTQFDPVDPAGLDYRLAAAHAKAGDKQQATKHVIAALDEAPRYRDALRLLLELVEPDAEEAAATGDEPSADAEANVPVEPNAEPAQPTNPEAEP